MSFRIIGLSPEPFRPLFAMSDQELASLGALRIIARDPRMPCRVSLEHARIGEEVLLLNHEYQSAVTPYRGRHAIFVRRTPEHAFDAIDTIPEALSSRLLSVRAFDAEHMMRAADVAPGSDAGALFDTMLADNEVAYLHVHNAKQGCYAARVERAHSNPFANRNGDTGRSDTEMPVNGVAMFGSN